MNESHDLTLSNDEKEEEVQSSRSPKWNAFSFTNEAPVIALCGLIAVGKSTAGQALSSKLSLPFYKEEVDDNPYLPLFYKAIKVGSPTHHLAPAYSFALQIYLLNKRYKQHQQLVWAGKGGITDRSLYEDKMFADVLKMEGMFSDLDHGTYVDAFENMANQMKKPDVIIYLWAPAEVCFERIKKRGREIEKDITLEYMQDLYQTFERSIEQLSHQVKIIKGKLFFCYIHGANQRS